MANLTEFYGWNHVYDYVVSSGWFGSDNGYGISDYLDVVEDVIVNGNRYLPTNVVEHDWIGDIYKIETNGVSTDIYNMNNYIPYQTIIYNNFGAVYKFVGFAPGGDPFGYVNF